MKHWKDGKRFLSLLMLVAMLVTSLPASFVSAFAETDTTVYGGIDLESFLADKIKDEDEDENAQPDDEKNSYVVQAVARTDKGLGGGSIVGESMFEVVEGESCTIEYQADAGYRFQEAFFLDGDGKRIDVAYPSETSATIHNVSANLTVFVVFAQQELVKATVVNGELVSITKDESDPSRYYISYKSNDPELYRLAGITLRHADGSESQAEGATEDGVWLDGITALTSVVVTFERPWIAYEVTGKFPNLESEGGGYTEEVVYSGQAEAGSTVTVAAEQLEREGFTLLPDDEGTVLEGVATANGELALTAVYERNTYKLSFSISEESEERAGEILTLQDVEFGDTVIVEEYPEVEEEGMVFTGWSRSMFSLPSTPEAMFAMPATAVVYQGGVVAANGDPTLDTMELCWKGAAYTWTNTKAIVPYPYPEDGKLSLSVTDLDISCDTPGVKGAKVVKVEGIKLRVKNGLDKYEGTEVVLGVSVGDEITVSLELESKISITVEQDGSTVRYQNYPLENTDNKASVFQVNFTATCTKTLEIVANSITEEEILREVAMFDGKPHMVAPTGYQPESAELQYSLSNNFDASKPNAGWVSYAQIIKDIEVTKVSTSGNGNHLSAKEVYVRHIGADGNYHVYQGFVLVYHRPIDFAVTNYEKDYDGDPLWINHFISFTESGAPQSAAFQEAFSNPNKTLTYEIWPDNKFNTQYVNVYVPAELQGLAKDDYASKTGVPLRQGDYVSSAQITDTGRHIARGTYPDVLVPAIDDILDGSNASVRNQYYVFTEPGDLIINKTVKQHYDDDDDEENPDGPTEGDHDQFNFGNFHIKIIYDGISVRAGLERGKLPADKLPDADALAYCVSDTIITAANYQNAKWTNFTDDGELPSYTDVGVYYVYIKVETESVTHLGVSRVEVVPRPVVFTAAKDKIIYTEAPYSRKTYVTAKTGPIAEDDWTGGVLLELDKDAVAALVAKKVQDRAGERGEYFALYGDQKFSVDVINQTGAKTVKKAHENELIPDITSVKITPKQENYAFRVVPGDLWITKTEDPDFNALFGKNEKVFDDTHIEFDLDLSKLNLGTTPYEVYYSASTDAPFEDWKKDPYDPDLLVIDATVQATRDENKAGFETIYVIVRTENHDYKGHVELTIFLRPITVTATQKEYTYTGRAVHNEDGKLGIPYGGTTGRAITDGIAYQLEEKDAGLLKTHTLTQVTVRAVREYINASTYANALLPDAATVAIANGQSGDETSNYRIIPKEGTLIIEKKKITIKPEEEEKHWSDPEIDEDKWPVEIVDEDGNKWDGGDDIDYDSKFKDEDADQGVVGDYDVIIDVDPKDNPNYEIIVDPDEGKLRVYGYVKYHTNYPSTRTWDDATYTDSDPATSAYIKYYDKSPVTLLDFVDIQNREGTTKFPSTGLRFLNWTKDTQDKNSTAYYPSGALTMTGPQDIVMYAQWAEVQQNKLTIQHVVVGTDEVLFKEEKHLNAGETYDERSRTFEGYTLVGADRYTGTMPASDVLLTFYYTKNTDVRYPLTVQHLEKGTNKKLYPDTIGNYPEGWTYFVPAQSITGYVAIDPKYVTGVMPAGPAQGIIYYEPTSVQQYVLTVYHRSTSTGAIIADTDVQTVAVGNTYRVNAKSISGYTVVGDGYVTGTMPAANTDRTIWYNRNSSGGTVTPTSVPTTNPTAAPTSTTSSGGGLTIHPSTSQNPGTGNRPSTGEPLTEIDDAAVPLGNITSPNVGECFE